ncbi:MAG: dihydrodipicolinate synthase family protein [Planctomycetota bacterium]
MQRKTEGLIAAPFTPMHADGSLHLEAVDSYARHLKQNGVIGAFICGTTGEGMSLTIDERRHVAERWVAAAPAGLRVIVHVGHTALAECRALAAHAKSIGADSVACIAPFFYKPAGVPDVVDWCTQVASAAPTLPFYYYHMPSMTGVSLRVSEFLAAAANRIPNLAGVKFTFEDLEDFGRCLQFEGGRFDVLFGRDELLLSALELGARGAVGSTYNFAAPLYHAMIAAHRQGDQGRAVELQALAVQMIAAFVQCGAHPIAAFKWFMQCVGVDCGPPRLPLREPTAEQEATLRTQLEQIGVFDWVSKSSDLTCANP